MKARITRDGVYTVADELLAAGEPVTVRAVRSKLGAGSFATITKHLSRWRADRAQALEVAAIQSAPVELVEATHGAVLALLKSGLNGVFEQIEKANRQRVAYITNSLLVNADEAEAEALREIAKLEARAELVEKQAEAQAAQLLAAQAAQVQAETRNKALCDQLSQMEARALKAEAAANQLSVELGGLKATIEHLRRRSTTKQAEPKPVVTAKKDQPDLLSK